MARRRPRRSRTDAAPRDDCVGEVSQDDRAAFPLVTDERSPGRGLRHTNRHDPSGPDQSRACSQRSEAGRGPIGQDARRARKCSRRGRLRHSKRLAVSRRCAGAVLYLERATAAPPEPCGPVLQQRRGGCNWRDRAKPLVQGAQLGIAAHQHVCSIYRAGAVRRPLLDGRWHRRRRLHRSGDEEEKRRDHRNSSTRPIVRPTLTAMPTEASTSERAIDWPSSRLNQST